MVNSKKKENQAKKEYKWIYDNIISKLYDIGLKIGLTPPGERILRISVYESVLPYIQRKDKILDLCCGTGTLTVLLSDLLYSDCEIIGVDLSNGQIAQARKKVKNSNIKFEVMNANNLKFKDGSIDKVIISAALHEMNKSERMNVLLEVYRVLKKEGYFLIFEHHEPSKTSLRIYYNFYLGFSEKLLSHSFEMQRNILMELRNAEFNILSQTPIKKFYSFFQIILSTK